MMKLYLLMVQKSLILLYVWTKFCSMKISQEIVMLPKPKRNGSQIRKFIEQGKKFTFKTTNLQGL
jgi:hypothetical protein